MDALVDSGRLKRCRLGLAMELFFSDGNVALKGSEFLPPPTTIMSKVFLSSLSCMIETLRRIGNFDSRVGGWMNSIKIRALATQNNQETQIIK